MVKRTTRTLRLADSSPHKKFPNGLKSVLKSIRKFWPNDISTEIRNDRAFAKGPFGTRFNMVAGYYGKKSKGPSALKKRIEKLEANGKYGTDISFYEMRAYAEFVGLPTGLLLVYTQLVSVEAEQKGDKAGREHVSAELQKMILGMRALEAYLVSASSKAPALHDPDKDPEGVVFQARMAGLRAMSAAYTGKAPE